MLKTNVIEGAHKLLKTHMHRIGFEYSDHICKSGRKIGIWKKTFTNSTAKPDSKFTVVPGFGDTPLTWLSVIAPFEIALKSQYSEWNILDFPGYSGFLAKDPAIESIQEHLDNTHEILNLIEPQTILGHSLGGWSSIHHAVKNFENKTTRSPRLILINPSGVLLRDEDEQVWKEIFDQALKHGFEAYKKHYIHRAPLWLPLIKPVLNEFFERKEVRNFIYSVEREHFLNERIAQITSPVDLIWSEFDSLNPVRWLEDWKGLIPHANITLLKSVGHSPQLERPIQTMMTLGSVLLGKPQWMDKNPLKRWLWTSHATQNE